MAEKSLKTVLVFMAHPDDAEILCGGTLLLLRALGWNAHIATATAGDCGSMDRSAKEISAIRREEARRAAAKLGAGYTCLEEPDGRVAYDGPTVQKAIDLFRQVAPDLVITHAEKDYMMDHEQVHLLARGASFMHGCPNVSALPLKPGTKIPHLYYADPVEGIDPYGRPVVPTTLIDISKVIRAKSDLLAEHASQRDWLRAHHGMDEYIEAMKRQAAWRGKQAGWSHAEGFVQHRGHAYPPEDLLSGLLGGISK